MMKLMQANRHTSQIVIAWAPVSSELVMELEHEAGSNHCNRVPCCPLPYPRSRSLPVSVWKIQDDSMAELVNNVVGYQMSDNLEHSWRHLLLLLQHPSMGSSPIRLCPNLEVFACWCPWLCPIFTALRRCYIPSADGERGCCQWLKYTIRSS